MIREYRSRSVFNIVTIGVDKAFNAIKSELEDAPYNVSLTTCDADRHVEVVKRMIRFVKERIRTINLAMPYKTIPKRFTIEMVHCVVVLMNSLPRKGSLHSVLSPREIVTGKKF